MMIETTHLVTLDCHHVLRFTVAPPMVGDDLYCVRCNDMRKAVDAPVEYRLRCKRCTYSRRFGTARLNAEQAAMKHRRKHPTHKVAIYNGRDLIYVMGANDDTAQGEIMTVAAVRSRLPHDPPF